MKIASDRDEALHTTTTMSPPSSPPGGPSPDPLDYRGASLPPGRLPLHRRRTFVAVAIASSVLLVVASMASIYRRWYDLRLPTSYILLVGDETTANAEVRVLYGRRELARETLKEESGKYEVPVLVEPGLYTIEARVEGKLVFVAKVVLPGNARGVRIDVTLRPNPAEEALLPPSARAFRPDTRPASRPGG